MLNQERALRPQQGSINFERRNPPRFSIHLPIEYMQIEDCQVHPGRTADIGEGGLLLYLSEPVEIAQILRLKLSCASLHYSAAIEALVQVVWRDMQVGNDKGYRVGVKFVEISHEDLNRLKKILWRN
jgi:c-di-GMP-binding flagellar brake protein YcgR